MVFDAIPDLYSPGGLPALNEVGFFTGQCDPLVTDPFPFEAPSVHPVDHDMFTFVSICVSYFFDPQ